MLTHDGHRTTHDDGRQPIAIGHLSDSGDLKKPKHPYMLVGGGGQNVEVKDITWVLPSIILFCFGGKSMIFLISPLKEQGHN